MSDSVVQVCSVGTARPGPPIGNAELGEYLGMSASFEQWADAFIGIRTRYLAIDLATAEVNFSLADLGELAATRALAGAGIAPAEIELIIMGTSMPDSLLPTTVNLIADRLGIGGVPTFQLQSGCTGAMQALEIAHAMLTSGQRGTALVIGGDVCAKHVDLSVDYAALPPAEWVNAVLFGDGVGAVVLRATTAPPPETVLLNRVLTRFTGLGAAPGQIVEWFGLRDRHEDIPAVREDYKAIERKVPELATEMLGELLELEEWKREELDFLLPPQLSPRMTGRIVEQLDVPRAAEISCVEETGNTANALPFFQLEMLLPRMVAGQRAAAVAIESSKWVKAGLTLEKTP